MRKFAVFILTHGRPDNVITYRTLRSQGYTGEIYLIVDDEDPTVDAYMKEFGAEWVIMFNKKQMADSIDEANNWDDRRAIVHARNATWGIAKSLGLTHFVQLDDDYVYFYYRDMDTWAKVASMDRLFDSFVDFLESTPSLAIATGQGGDHIGGFMGWELKRKTMNFWVCATDRPFVFNGQFNEDVNTYVVHGSRGGLFFTFTGIQLGQVPTQAAAGGMTEIYLKRGTYVKSFTTVLMHPSSVKVAVMQTTNRRMHHLVNWKATVPKILPSIFRKEDPVVMPTPEEEGTPWTD